MTLATNQEPADEAAALDKACGLIVGPVGIDAPPANYGWLLNDSGTYTRIESTLVDAAHRRGELALAAGDVERASWAARQGLLVVEGQEALYRIQMRAAAEQGDTEAIKAAYQKRNEPPSPTAAMKRCNPKPNPSTNHLPATGSLTTAAPTGRTSVAGTTWA